MTDDCVVDPLARALGRALLAADQRQQSGQHEERKLKTGSALAHPGDPAWSHPRGRASRQPCSPRRNSGFSAIRMPDRRAEAARLRSVPSLAQSRVPAASRSSKRRPRGGSSARGAATAAGGPPAMSARGGAIRRHCEVLSPAPIAATRAVGGCRTRAGADQHSWKPAAACEPDRSRPRRGPKNEESCMGKRAERSSSLR